MMKSSVTTARWGMIGRDLVLAALLIGVALLISSFVPERGGRFSSIETKFADSSHSGLAIVPASCPSDPHTIGECTPPQTSYTPTPVCTPGQWDGTSCRRCDGTGQWAASCTDYGGAGDAGWSSSAWCSCATRCTGSTPQSCQTTTCPNGLNIAQYPTCQCPVGQTQVGDHCETPPAQTTYQTSYGPGQTSYGPGQTSYQTSYETSYTCWDGSQASSQMSCPPCPEGYTKVGTACIPPESPNFVGFTTPDGFHASGHLEVRPALVRSGDTTKVYWNVVNVRDCTVTGTNHDSWSATGSGTSGKTSGAITMHVDYTLFCHALVGATPSTITETKSVNIIPNWNEPAGN